jgi:tetratricopeptide (TPR) repeat protein
VRFSPICILTGLPSTVTFVLPLIFQARPPFGGGEWFGITSMIESGNCHSVPLVPEDEAAWNRLLPHDHPVMLKAMNNLANSYYALNRHAEALKLYEETLAARKRVLPPDHPLTLSSITNLARSYVALNRHPEALSLVDEVLAKANRPGVRRHGRRLRSRAGVAQSSSCRESAARNSRRLRYDMVLLPWGTGSRGRRSPAPVVEVIDQTVILATQLINAAALHDRLGKAWAVPEASTCSLHAFLFRRRGRYLGLTRTAVAG